jgi:hypothetical protein
MDVRLTVPAPFHAVALFIPTAIPTDVLEFGGAG